MHAIGQVYKGKLRDFYFGYEAISLVAATSVSTCFTNL
jgi:hypothetical protein